jgi:hypothetical protein
MPNMHQVVINPDGGNLRIDDVHEFLASFPADQEPMVDVGGGELVPLQELADDADEDDDES